MGAGFMPSSVATATSTGESVVRTLRFIRDAASVSGLLAATKLR